ncbi:hypothetical protein QJS10_CPA05g00036 [Acorus calamus]|uniref:Uncharacterized protein n=1 Tax=Acorus calamus TaxID=4465 RepID=A0AAV9EXF3_ACOCL|nr:hypothetical protein QJS10_CPA05g00036 [Acorus calamus]
MARDGRRKGSSSDSIKVAGDGRREGNNKNPKTKQRPIDGWPLYSSNKSKQFEYIRMVPSTGRRSRIKVTLGITGRFSPRDHIDGKSSSDPSPLDLTCTNEAKVQKDEGLGSSVDEGSGRKRFVEGLASNFYATNTYDQVAWWAMLRS